jgi:hypothetical protein
VNILISFNQLKLDYDEQHEWQNDFGIGFGQHKHRLGFGLRTRKSEIRNY